jgi:hypothetical protein
MGSILKSQAIFLDHLTPSDVNDKLSWNVGNYPSKLPNIPEERRSLLHYGESMKSWKAKTF